MEMIGKDWCGKGNGVPMGESQEVHTKRGGSDFFDQASLLPPVHPMSSAGQFNYRRSPPCRGQ